MTKDWRDIFISLFNIILSTTISAIAFLSDFHSILQPFPHYIVFFTTFNFLNLSFLLIKAPHDISTSRYPNQSREKIYNINKRQSSNSIAKNCPSESNGRACRNTTRIGIISTTGQDWNQTTFVRIFNLWLIWLVTYKFQPHTHFQLEDDPTNFPKIPLHQILPLGPTNSRKHKIPRYKIFFPCQIMTVMVPRTRHPC